MTKHIITADVYIHQSENDIAVDDYKALNAWMNGHGAFVDLDGTLMYIPYESITMIVLFRESEEVEAPEDPLCQPVTCETTEPCDPPEDDNEDDPPDDDNGGDDTP